MRAVYSDCFIIALIIQFMTQVHVSSQRVVVSNDGPTILGGSITFRADIYWDDGSRPSGTFSYIWKDDALNPHEYTSPNTGNTTSYWTVTYPVDRNSVGSYRLRLVVEKRIWPIWRVFGNAMIDYKVTELLNGNMTLTQSNEAINGDYISSNSTTDLRINFRKGDYDFVKAKGASSIMTFWFIDCKSFGPSPNFTFNHHFSEVNTTQVIEALVIVSYDPPVTTTTSAPTTVAPLTTTSVPNTTTSTTPSTTTTTLPSTASLAPKVESNATMYSSAFFTCSNATNIPQDPNKTYGYFAKTVKVRAPISNITVSGTNWLQPWEMLSLNVSCKGSGPFKVCLSIHPGNYNITGNETCEAGTILENCSFPIIHYFLEASVYTYLVVLENDVSIQRYPLTINIYKVTTKPQLSVIVVPVSCSLAAMVLIVFGIAYYMQSRARFTVEVADFDFGQHNPELEYKTFTERLRDSINSSLRPGGDRINGYEALNKPLLE
ncbi:uncharacterized protein LOC107221185 [Neodiprion lecontei]|uniref:Uncharacterized protein LOC107221185 n=1 Tax=Neodiprion lecontei TaxID=441921 RepID=A0A6J0BLV2_NEOLC|nr:uncharacterized protein LOC107221185 [Neodiprion lecontei]